MHRVLAAENSSAYASMRDQPVSREERYALGRELRQRVPRTSLADWKKPDNRADPVDQVHASHQGRLDWLIPVRVSRMIASPYGFLRGTAGLMAADVTTLPATGIMPVICGDAHMGNFGFYASPERELVFDLNDFDESHPGSWEWDLRRLAASIWVAGRQNSASEEHCASAVHSCVQSYREQIRRLAEMPLLQRHFEGLDVDRLRETAGRSTLRKLIERSAKRARKRTSDRALPRFTEERDGQRRIVQEPPLITSLTEIQASRLTAALDDYLASLPSQWRRVLAGYTVRDVAHKVVGVGSVGLRAYVVLCEGSSPDDVLFLQLKQARRSVIARYVHGDSAWHAHQGQRVVEYQHALQTASDPLLGWTSFDGFQFYVRQFRNMKGAIDIEDIDDHELADYARICGHLLAKGHARTSGASMIAGYLGKSDKVDDALTKFAQAYANQTEEDHQALVDAVKQGKIPADAGAS